MALVYDPKTGKTTGEMTELTDVEEAEREARLASGRYGIFSRHPSQGTVDALLDQQEKHGFGWGIKKLIREIRDGSTSES